MWPARGLKMANKRLSIIDEMSIIVLLLCDIKKFVLTISAIPNMASD